MIHVKDVIHNKIDLRRVTYGGLGLSKNYSDETRFFQTGAFGKAPHFYLDNS